MTPETRRVRTRRALDWAFPPAPVRRELITRLPRTDQGKPPLLFVHGGWHGAWCYAEHWLPHAAERGFPAYAVSLRGHGESGGRDRLRRTLLRDYVHDVLQATVSLPTKPVLIGHSLGALVVQQVLARYPARAAVLMTPLRHGHGVRTALRILRRRPLDLLQAVAGRPVPPRAEYLYRGLDRLTAQERILRFDTESPLVQYQMILPRRAERPVGDPPVLVLGSRDDQLVPVRDVRAVARFVGARLEFVDHVGHDLVLDADWRQPLDVVLDWVEQVCPRADD